MRNLGNIEKEIGYSDGIADVKQIASRFVPPENRAEFELALAELERSYYLQCSEGTACDFNHAAYLIQHFQPEAKA